MATLVKIEPPFAWLGRYWAPVGLATLGMIAAFFRFYQLGVLPPGLDETSARIGIEALKLSPTHLLPALDSWNGYAPLWVWLQTLSIHVFGHTMLALRVWSALVGLAAVGFVWLWIKDWFGTRPAWTAAVLMAVCPWPVTVARSGLPTALITMLVPLCLWLAIRVVREPTSRNYLALGAALAACLLSGPLGWLTVLCILIMGCVQQWHAHELLVFKKPKAIGISIFAAGAAAMAYFVGTSLPAIRDLPHTLGASFSWATLGGNVMKVLLMFNVHGDENYRHNLSGEPLLNAFVGIMLVAGLLVSISRLHKQVYRALLALLVILLAPAFFAPGIPNASWAAAAMPIIFALVGLGTAYMLELWYATFPINSAARATGQAAIIVLLALSALQGYTQYFRAYAGSTAVYSVFNEGTTQLALHAETDKFKAERYAVVPEDQVPVVEYLDYGQPRFHAITPSQLQLLPIAAANRLFYITAASRDEAVKTLKAKFPGGVLRPHISDFNLDEIYYTYEVGQ